MDNRTRHPAKAKRLPLPVGNSDWAVVREGYWSADKTQLISGLLDKKATVALFTRPRRFGKTFALEMLHTFFEKTEKSNAARDEYDRHQKVFFDKGCIETARAFHRQLRLEQTTPRNFQRAIGIFAAALHAHYGERPVILIDEYDSL